MTVYTTITDATLTSGKPGTQAVFRALRDNAIAITEKAAGAPVLANAYVTQAMLKTTTGELSTTTETIATLPGGEYGFWPQQRVNNAANYIYLLATAANVFNSPSLNSTTFTSRISFGMSVGTGGDASFVRQRYIQASPPYDLGDGEIPLFIFAIINPDGSIQSTCIAPDAPWHNNGPTTIRPDWMVGRIGFQRHRQIIAEFGSIKAAIQSGLTRTQVMDRLATDPMIDREVTQEIKNSDMPLIPHPFIGNNLTGKTVVLLDPVSPLMTRLLGLHDSGESVSEIVRSWLTVGNTALARSGPPGVIVVNATLK